MNTGIDLVCACPPPVTMSWRAIISSMIFAIVVGVLIVGVVAVQRWLNSRRPSSSALSRAQTEHSTFEPCGKDVTFENSLDDVDTTFEDCVTEAVEQARADLLALAQDPWFQMSAWNLAGVVTDAVAALRAAAKAGSDDTGIESDASVLARDGLLIDALNDATHDLARYPNEPFRSYMAGWQACNRMDIATEHTRRQLNEMWIPSPYRPMNYANSIYGPFPAEPAWPPSKTERSTSEEG